jgi:fimbrial chaperone protein
MKLINFSINSCNAYIILLVALVTLSPFPSMVYASDWRVVPIRLDLSKKVKTGILTVVNESNNTLQVQMKAMRWTQDDGGKDRYTETSDIIFFPKIMALNPHEERIIRAGTRQSPGTQERTYRLFIEEIPARTAEGGPVLSIAIRFGAPIFVAPVKVRAGGSIDGMKIAKNTLTIPLTNTGNVHYRIQSLMITGKNKKGEDTFSQKLEGWYLLSGASRIYTSALPSAACRESSRIEVQALTDKLVIKDSLDIVPEMCAQ